MIQTVSDFGGIYEVTLATGAVLWVPKDEANTDYAAVRKWEAEGGAIAPGSPPA